MECAVLGELRVLDAGIDRTPPGRRSRDLLVALLLRRGQAVDATVLLDQVWGDEAAGLTVAVVHTQVARLRRALGAERVKTTEAGYRLGDVDVDADRFAALVSQSRGGNRPQRSIVLLREALALWRAERPFTDVSAELVAPEAARLGGLRTGALELLAERLLETADPASLEEASIVAGQLMAAEPLRERGYEIGMAAAAAAGRRSEALACFERLRTTLRTELGIDPGPAARRLQLRLLEGDWDVAPATTGARAWTTPPAAMTALIGRDHDLAQVTALVSARRLVTITGLGGVGKTRLLSELSSTLDPSCEQAYVDLATLTEPTPAGTNSVEITSAELAEAVGQSLGIATGRGDPPTTIARAIDRRRLILMFDECERSPAAVGGLARILLSRCPRLSVLTASRTPLDVVGEVEYPLAPLTCPAPDTGAKNVGRASAVVLLRERIADHSPDLVLDDAAILRLGAFARRVDGLPLALELLAAQSSTRSLEQLATLLDAPLALASEEAGHSGRHSTLHATIAWSVDRIPAHQREALYRLSVFVGPFDAAAAGMVGGPDLDIDQSLRALVREALVHTERTTIGLSYRLLRPVGDLAHRRLVESGDLVRVSARHRSWHAGRWRTALRSDALLLDVRHHYADYLAALRGSLDDGDARAIADLTLTLSRLWNFADMLGPALRWTGRALSSGLLTPLEHARVTSMRSAVQVHHSPGEVRRDLQRAIPVLTEQSDAAWLVTAHMVACLERSTSGEHARALSHARQAVEAARATTKERQADAWGVLAVAAGPIAPGEAEHAARQAWTLVTRSGSAAAVASVASNLAWAHICRGRPDIAADLVERALGRLRPDEVPDFLRLNRAWTYLLSERAADALADFAGVIASNPDASEDRRSAEVYLGAACALAAGRHRSAPEILAGAAAMATRTGLVLLDWQETLLDQARERITDLPPPSWTSSLAAGPDLARLVTDAALPAGTPIGESGGRSPR